MDMPENVKNFCNMIGNQIKGDWKTEDYEVFKKIDGWKVRMNTSEISFFFSESGEFKFCSNYKE